MTTDQHSEWRRYTDDECGDVVVEYRARVSVGDCARDEHDGGPLATMERMTAILKKMALADMARVDA